MAPLPVPAELEPVARPVLELALPEPPVLELAPLERPARVAVATPGRA